MSSHQPSPPALEGGFGTVGRFGCAGKRDSKDKGGRVPPRGRHEMAVGLGPGREFSVATKVNNGN